jgi:hypothetical protein
MPSYQIYYGRKPTFHASGEFGTPRLTVSALLSSHIRLCQVEAGHMDDAFWQMQAENWSPHGEARPLIQSLGLSHTSMSVGDVIQDEGGVYWECLDRGWRQVEDDTQGEEGHAPA